MLEIYLVSLGVAVMPICVAAGKYSRISRHAESTTALPRWHSSITIRSKNSRENSVNLLPLLRPGPDVRGLGFRFCRSKGCAPFILALLPPCRYRDAVSWLLSNAAEHKLGRLKCGCRDVFASANGETDMVISHGQFVWYELMTANIESAKAFYASVVGWGTRGASMPGPAYNLFTVGNAPVTGIMNLPEDARAAGVTPHWLGYVGVDDVDAAVDRIKQLGGAVHVAPTNVPNVGRFSVVADPQSATLALVKGLKPGQERADLFTPGHVGWHELLAADWEKAFAFYGELFGWRRANGHIGAMGAYQQFSAGGKTIGGMFSKPPDLPLPFWLYYFNVAGIEAAVKRVEACGGHILYGPTAVPGGAWIAHCTDSQGAIFALLDRRIRKAIEYSLRGAS
jgi:uncharacterized protein